MRNTMALCGANISHKDAVTAVIDDSTSPRSQRLHNPYDIITGYSLMSSGTLLCNSILNNVRLEQVAIHAMMEMLMNQSNSHTPLRFRCVGGCVDIEFSEIHQFCLCKKLDTN